MNDLRFSPNGKYLAFITHSNPSDDRGTAIIMRSTGEKVAASPLYESAQGLAWSASGDEVWSSSPLGWGKIHALSLSGKTRDPLTVPGRLRLRDVAADGQLLVEQGIARRGMVVSSNHGAAERDLSWLDFGYLRALSDDGKTILFEEEGSETQSYKVFVRGVDGSPAIPIGEGYGLALSPNKNWVLSEKLTEPIHEIWLLPVGPGEPRRMTPPNLAPNIAASFLSDGKRIVYEAREADHPLRTWIQDVNGENPRPITPEGTAGWLVSPDDKWLIVGRRQAVIAVNEATLVALQGGSEQKIQGLKPGETVLGWTGDGQLYVGSAPNVQHLSINETAEILGLPGARSAVHVDKLNPHTGARTVWRDLAMPPIGGVLPDPPIITRDGVSYAFDYRLRLSDLYTVSGVR